MSGNKFEKPSSNCVTVDKVARQIEAVTGLLAQQLESICQLMQELKNEQSGRDHEETTSFRATIPLSGSGGQFVSVLILQLIFRQ